MKRKVNKVRSELEFIKPAVDYFKYTEGLKGGKLYSRVADYIWRNDVTNVPPGVIRVCEDARENFSEYDSIYFTDVGIELTPNFNPNDYEY